MGFRLVEPALPQSPERAIVCKRPTAKCSPWIIVLFPELLPPTSTLTPSRSMGASEIFLNRWMRIDERFIIVCILTIYPLLTQDLAFPVGGWGRHLN